MRKRLVIVLVFFALMLTFSVSAFVEDINLSHTLTGFIEGADSVTLNITLHVTNSGLTAYNNLKLSYVPFMVIAIEEVKVNLTTIEAGQTLDIPITIVTPVPFNRNIFEEATLFWAGELDNPDVSGAIVEFPASSYHVGGAQ